MTSTHRNPVRWLAPVALLVCALAVLLVVTGGGSDGGSSTRTEQRSTSTSSKRSAAKRSKKARRIYHVRSGDTLGGIAQRTGVPLSELQALNPQLDAQALQTGQKVKLRP